MKNNRIITLFLSLYSVTILAQQVVKDTIVNSHEVYALYERTPNKVTLRWAPSTTKIWMQGIYNGYTIYKSEVKLDTLTTNIDFNKMQKIAVVRPKDKQQWLDEMKAMDKDKIPKVLAASYQCIYGEYESLKNAKGFSGWQDQANELQNRYSFSLYMADLNKQAAGYSGFLYEDTDIQPNKEYIYIVQPNLKLRENEGLLISPGVAEVSTEITKYLPPKLTAVQGEKSVKLLWPRKNVSERKNYTAYYIERAEKGAPFKQLNELPYIHAVSRDSVFYHPMNIYTDSVANYKKYKYRIRGITPFGSLGEYSNEIEAMGVDKTPPTPPEYIETNYFADGKMLIKWEKEEEQDLKGYNVFKANDIKEKFYKINEKLIPAGTKRFVDEKVNPLLNHFYIIMSVDKENNYSKSNAEFAMIVDTIPPSKPTGLKGIIDTTGVLTLSWKKNKELDIKGYKVFFANENNHEYVLLNGEAIRDTIFKHKITLNTLTEEAWFKVRAVDKRYNYSELSEPVKIMRPDTIPPTSPIFKKYKVNQNDIYLKWANSSSKDVVRHELWRKNSKQDNWKMVSTFKNNEIEYTDKEIENNKRYVYKIVAVDDANLLSPVASMLSLDAKKVLKKGISSLQAVVTKDKKVKLTWQSANTDNSKLIIYRSVDNQGFKPIRTLQSSESEYIDPFLRNNTKVNYAIQILFNDGTTSPYSNVVNIYK